MSVKVGTIPAVIILIFAVHGFFLWQSTRASQVDPANAALARLAGSYALDRADYRSRLLRVAREWTATNTEGLPEAKQAETLKRELEKAEAGAQSTSIRLELRADATFRLQLVNKLVEATGTGTWSLDGDEVTLDTLEVEGPHDQGPIPSLRLRVSDGALLVQASPGVPFEHRLQRVDD